MPELLRVSAAFLADIDTPVAELARNQRSELVTLATRLGFAERQLEVAERQVRDLVRDNERLKRELAGLKSR